MNPLYDSDLEMIPSTDKKNYKTQPAKNKYRKTYHQKIKENLGDANQ